MAYSIFWKRSKKNAFAGNREYNETYMGNPEPAI